MSWNKHSRLKRRELLQCLEPLRRICAAYSERIRAEQDVSRYQDFFFWQIKVCIAGGDCLRVQHLNLAAVQHDRHGIREGHVGISLVQRLDRKSPRLNSSHVSESR